MMLSRKVNVLQYSLKRAIIAAQRNYASEGDHYDIVIAGGGLVGTTLACTLGKNNKLSNKRILLLEAGKEFQWTPTEQYSNRVVALNPQTYDLFNKINVWKNIAANRFSRVKKLQVWDGVSDSMIAFSNSNFDDPVAYVVENNLILASVNEEAKKLANVSIVNEAKIKSYNLADHENKVSKITLENDSSYTCDLLLGCDGAKSKVRDVMGVHYLSWDYNQMAIVATLNLSETPDNFIAWQRFLPSGPIAMLPLKENLSSLVWSTSPERAQQLLALPEEQFVDAVNSALWKTQSTDPIVSETIKLFDTFMKSFNFPSNAVRQLPPSVTKIEEKSRAAFPLAFGHASCYVANGVALVGDAAHRVHPLAGQGVNLGFGDVTALDNILGSTVYSGAKLGDLSYLKQYESERQRHNLPTMIAIDSLHRLYTTDSTPIVLLRSLGLQLTHALEPIKKTIINQGST